MRVLIIRTTGIFNDSRTFKEINTFLKNGFVVTVFGWNRESLDNSNKQIQVGNNIANIVFCNVKSSFGRGKKNLFSFCLFQIWKIIHLIMLNKRYDIIHCCDFDTTFGVKVIAKIFNKKIVYDIFDYYVDSHNMGKLTSIIEKHEISFINNADLTIICTEQRKIQIEKAKPQKLIVIHNSPNVSYEKRSIVKSHSNKFKICYVGVLQNGRLLKEISNELVKCNDIELHIGGVGPLADFFNDLSNNNQNVYYYGSLMYNDVLNLEEQCDMLFATYDPCNKNNRFSAPNKIYEALALGKPIIVCKNTGFDNMIENEKIGLSILYDGKCFVEAVNKIKNDFDFKLIKKRCNELYTDCYSWKIMEERLLDSYKNI